MGRQTALNKPGAMLNGPRPPAGMSAAGVKLWESTLTCKPAAEWTPADAVLLNVYVAAVLDVERLTAEITQHGELMRGANGVPVLSPLVALRQRRETVLMMAAKRLRLTPCSRYTARRVGELARHAVKARTAAAALDDDELLARPRALQ